MVYLSRAGLIQRVNEKGQREGQKQGEIEEKIGGREGIDRGI